MVIDELKMRAAREALILRNDSHLDQLTDKLKEPRVRAVIGPMLTGNSAYIGTHGVFAARREWRGPHRALESYLARHALSEGFLVIFD